MKGLEVAPQRLLDPTQLSYSSSSFPVEWSPARRDSRSVQRRAGRRGCVLSLVRSLYLTRLAGHHDSRANQLARSTICPGPHCHELTPSRRAFAKRQSCVPGAGESGRSEGRVFVVVPCRHSHFLVAGCKKSFVWISSLQILSLQWTLSLLFTAALFFTITSATLIVLPRVRPSQVSLFWSAWPAAGDRLKNLEAEGVMEFVADEYLQNIETLAVIMSEQVPICRLCATRPHCHGRISCAERRDRIASLPSLHAGRAIAA